MDRNTKEKTQNFLWPLRPKATNRIIQSECRTQTGKIKADKLKLYNRKKLPRNTYNTGNHSLRSKQSQQETQENHCDKLIEKDYEFPEFSNEFSI